MAQTEAATESVIKSDVTYDLPAVVESDVESTQVSLINDDKASNANIELSQFAKVISSESLEQNSQSVESSISQESASSYSSQSSSAQESSSSAVEANSEQTTVEPQSEVTEKSAQVEVSTDESSVPLVQVSLQQVQNIPDIIASLENENKAQQVFFKIIWIYVFVNFVFTCETVNKTMFQTGRAVNELAVQAG